MGVVANVMHKESSKMVSLGNSCNSEGKTEKPPSSKYKRRKVSCVRDFPPGCGPHAAPIERPGELAECLGNIENHVNGSKNSEVGATIQMNGIREESFSTEGSPAHLGLKTGKLDLSDGHCNGISMIDTQAVEKSAEELKPVNCPEPDSSDVVKDSLQVEPVEHCLERVRVRNLPPRRKVSGVRDFPPFCGPNAPHLSKGESTNLIASQKNDLGQKKSYNNEKLSEKIASDVSDAKKVIADVLNGIALEGHLEDEGATLAVVKTKSEPQILSTESQGDLLEAYSGHEITVELGVTQEQNIEFNCEISQCECKNEPTRVNKISKKDINGVVENSRWDLVAHDERKINKERPQDLSCSREQLLDERAEIIQVADDRLIVLGLMASTHCPWRMSKGASKREFSGGSFDKKGKKNERALISLSSSDSKLQKKKNAVEKGKKTDTEKKSSPVRSTDEGKGQLVLWREKDSLSHEGDICDYNDSLNFCDYEVSLPPSCPSSVNGRDSDSSSARSKVRETLRLFQVIYRRLLQEEESRLRGQGDACRRPDCRAAKILKEKGKYVNMGKRIIGPVPGVEVGDEFQYRVELNIVGLHRPTQSGIDYVNQGGEILATSIVATGGYDNNLDNSDVLIYTGQGGNVMQKGKQPEDQKLERGNLALANSKLVKNPIRVIRGESKSSDFEGRGKTYIYDGLYLVEEFDREVGPLGKLVFKFKLVRIVGQPELSWKVVRKSKKSTVREGLCVLDISECEESKPISAINTIDDEKPPPFIYNAYMIYPDWCHPIPPRGCDCTEGCSESTKCACVMKNGGEIPYNRNRAIVEAKNLVYECGPTCKCPPSCHNRVTQHGIQFQLEIFKTESRGWGVRSLNSIPSGSFICEYVGELLEDTEAEKRTGSDEYLFDIGNKYSDGSLWDGLSSLMPDAPSSSSLDVLDSGFTIDAAHRGNVGRFINHSCSPNLYAQNVLYDHEDRRIPHVMLFAVENIPPLQELTYHYNYVIDEVRDANGNIKRKSCYCGSSECTGRLY